MSNMGATCHAWIGMCKVLSAHEILKTFYEKKKDVKYLNNFIVEKI